jgi:hypothetical protein
MSDLLHFWLPRRELRSRPKRAHCGTAPGKMPHHLLEAICDAISAQRKYERLTSLGIGHEPALKAALSEMGHCQETGAHRVSTRSASHVLMAAVAAWIDSRRECKRAARLDERCRPYPLKAMRTRSPALNA